MQWYCSGCNANHEFPDVRWGGVGAKRFCATTYPGRRLLPKDGMSVRLSAERYMPWLSRTPLPVGTTGKIVFRIRELFAPTPVVEFDEYRRALLPNTEAHSAFPLICGRYLPLWLETNEA